MKLIPWRNRDDLTMFHNEWEGVFNRLFDGDTQANLPEVLRRATMPAVNVAETEKTWTVAFELPGLDEKDIQVQVMGRQLIVSGERKWADEKKGKEFHRVESQYGAFQRAIELPENARLEADAIQASYKKGILEISVPKMEPTPAAKIPVKVG